MQKPFSNYSLKQKDFGMLIKCEALIWKKYKRRKESKKD